MAESLLPRMISRPVDPYMHCAWMACTALQGKLRSGQPLALLGLQTESMYAYGSDCAEVVDIMPVARRAARLRVECMFVSLWVWSLYVSLFFERVKWCEMGKER